MSSHSEPWRSAERDDPVELLRPDVSRGHRPDVELDGPARPVGWPGEIVGPAGDGVLSRGGSGGP
jgi:hypothetical protein